MPSRDQSYQYDAVHASYNSRILHMLSSRARWFGCALLLIGQFCFASDWHTPAAQLAGKISATTGPGVIALEMNNRSSISAAEVEQIRGVIVAELATAGVRVWQPDQAAAVAKVTLSENLSSFVWIAEIQQGAGEPKIAMISMDRPRSSLSAQNAPPLTLHATSLLSQYQPILDISILEGNTRRALVLTDSAVSVFEFKDSRWFQIQSLPIAHATPFPRDIRGRLVLRKDHLFDAYLPGVVCHSSEAGSLSMNCSRSDDPWPLAIADFGVSGFFAPARNFFTGVLTPGVGKQRSAPAFYSAAAVPKDKYVLWIFVGVDGQVHLLDGINQQTSGRLRWGSDIAGIRAACRPDWLVLASAPGEEEDSVQAFEIPDREPVAASQKLPIHGPITALWTQQNGESATAVYRNADTGEYEALQLTLACGQ
jgi:hypothetical protein